MYEEVKQIIENKGGIIISKEYTKAAIPIEFKCKNNHSCKKTRNQLKTGEFCNIFKRNKETNIYYQFYKNLIEKKDGKLIKLNYINVNSLVDYNCENGHLNKVVVERIKYDYWCKECTKEDKQKIANNYHLQYEKIAKENGFTLISNYINGRTKLKIKCENKSNNNSIYCKNK